MSKLTKMQRFLPAFYKPTSNEVNRGFLYAISGEDDLIVQAIENAKEQLFVKTAQLQFLDALGSNVGVFRPTAFHLADDQFQQLIPALSFYPKQVKPTVYTILYAFFGANNPLVKVYEINPNSLIIQIPSSVPSLRRSLSGSIHLKAYRAVVNSIDNVFKTMNVSLYGDFSIVADQFAGVTIGQGVNNATIVGNSAGNAITLQFPLGEDLSVFTTSQNIRFIKPSYPGAFMPDKARAYTVTAKRGVLGQSIDAGSIYPTILMEDASEIPDAPGFVTFNFGYPSEEGPIEYFGRPNNTTLLLDPAYNFVKAHSIGEVVNVVVKPYRVPRTDGSDYSAYFTGVEAARILAQQIVQSILAAGIVVEWIVVSPKC